jgi:hypothetical protein
MFAFLIQVLIFIAGFCVGYAARAWRLRRRKAQHVAGISQADMSRTTTFGRARRAF